MVTIFKRIWHDPVWSKVIAWAICGAALITGSYFAGWWHDIAQEFQFLISVLFASSLTPNWVLGILSLLSLCTLVIFGLVIYSALFKSNVEGSESYTSDEFFELFWEWDWGHGDIYNQTIVALCPRCKTRLEALRPSEPLQLAEMIGYGGSGRVRMLCTNCLFEKQFPGTLDRLVEEVKKQIERKIRTGEYKRK